MSKWFAFSGKIGAGKSTAAHDLCDTLKCEKGFKGCVVVVSFATALKEYTAKLYGFDVKLTRSAAGKETVVKNGGGRTVGQLLQFVGQQSRETMGDDVWARALVQVTNKIAKLHTGWVPGMKTIFIVDDLRHKVEMEVLSELGATTIRLNGDPGGVRATSTRDPNHPSETELDDCSSFDEVCCTDVMSAEQVTDLCVTRFRERAK